MLLVGVGVLPTAAHSQLSQKLRDFNQFGLKRLACLHRSGFFTTYCPLPRA